MIRKLVGLLVAVIVIAAIVFPMVAKERMRDRGTVCLNNVKQIATAIQMYEDDYPGGILPCTGGWQVWKWDQWPDLLEPYLENLHYTHGLPPERRPHRFSCPSAPPASRITWHGTTYGYNPYLTKSVTPSDVRYPSLTLRLTESAVYEYQVHNLPYGIRDARYRGGSLVCPMPKGRLKPSNLNPQAPGWHNGYQNVLWFDGTSAQ